jgi:hypothetical protein
MVGSTSSLMSTRSTARVRTNQSGSNLSTLSVYQNKVGKKPDSKVAINDKGLNDIYENIRRRRIKNGIRMNDFLENIERTTRKEMTDVLTFQEKVLGLKDSNDGKHQKFTNFLSHRTKKTDADMLMNNTHNYRVKKEINEFIEKNQPIEYKYGSSYWLMTLRRPENFKGVRYSYINLRDSYNPFWQLIKESIPNESEIVRVPYKTARELEEIQKHEYFKKSLNKLDIKIDTSMQFKNVTNLSVNSF